MSQSNDSFPKPYFRTLMVVGLWCTMIVASTYATFGTVEALRAVTSLAMPLSLVWLFVLATSVWWFLQKRTKLGAIYLLIWIAFTVVFNQHFAMWLVGRLENREYAPIESVAQLPLRAAVVLGGGVHMTPANMPEVNREGQRIFAAAQLWHAGQTRSIICTGERAGLGDNQSDIAKQLLTSIGVPENAILEIGGENTTQEMRNLKQLLDAPHAGIDGAGDVALITSAFHMPRALRLAKANELELIPIPVCYQKSQPAEFSLAQIIPGAETGETLKIAIKEILAELVGR